MKKFISLGPTCIPATILRDNDLRTETYGFDWSRSGFHHVEDFFTIPLDSFLERHAYYPNIPIIQTQSPLEANQFTSPIQDYRPLYGFPYLLNPHRDYTLDTTREYIKRSFLRLNHLLSSKSNELIFIIADYGNKPHYIFFHDPKSVVSKLERVIGIKLDEFKLILIRIYLAGFDYLGATTTYNKISSRSSILQVSTNSILDHEDWRHLLHRYIIKSLRIHALP